MRVLLIEDDGATVFAIQQMLSDERMNVYSTDLGEEGTDLAKLYDYDIVLLDLNLPDMSGYEVIRSIRAARVKTPILVVSGLAGVQDKVKALDLGADDYMTKPFHSAELAARIRAITRRYDGQTVSALITIGDLVINLATQTAVIAAQPVPLSTKEYQVLELLARRRGTATTKEIFRDHLYGGLDEPESNTIDVFIGSLRKKLAAAGGGANYIETIWGRGYVLQEPNARAVAGTPK